MLERLHFQSSKKLNKHGVFVMYLIEHAIVIIDWIIAYNCPNYTI